MPASQRTVCNLATHRTSPVDRYHPLPHPGVRIAVRLAPHEWSALTSFSVGHFCGAVYNGNTIRTHRGTYHAVRTRNNTFIDVIATRSADYSQRPTA